MGHLNVGSVGRLIPNDESSCSRCYLTKWRRFEVWRTLDGEYEEPARMYLRLWASNQMGGGADKKFPYLATITSCNQVNIQDAGH